MDAPEDREEFGHAVLAIRGLASSVWTSSCLHRKVELKVKRMNDDAPKSIRGRNACISISIFDFDFIRRKLLSMRHKSPLETINDVTTPVRMRDLKNKRHFSRAIFRKYGIKTVS